MTAPAALYEYISGKSWPFTLTGFLAGSHCWPFFLIVPEQFLLLGVHRNHRRSGRQGPLHLGVDMTELRIAVRMIRAFLSLPVTLQALILVAQKLRHFFMTDRMLLPSQLSCQIPSTLTDPTQGRFGIAPRFRFNQTIHCGE